MIGNVRDCARLGLVHHMLYPASLDDPAEHAATLAALVAREDIETFDCCLPYGDGRGELIGRIRDCGKTDITYAAHMFPIRKVSFASPSPIEQGVARLGAADMVAQAAAIRATGLIFPSGGPPPDQATPAHHEAFADFCRWLCGQCRPHGITALLEPFDMTVDKKFLYGPTRDCVALIESLAPEVDNLAIELDVAHLPLMGETFADALAATGSLLRRVHLGNCVLRDRSHPLYGDKHPPPGIEGGEIDVPELTDILRRLLDAGFLDKASRGCLVIEMTPWPGKTPDETVADSLERLDRAWQAV